jgi:hypothetical protein
MSPLPFYPLCGFGSLREELGGKETARLRLKLGSARRAAPTIFFDSWGFVMRSETAGDCRCNNGFSPRLCAFVRDC